MFTCCFLLILSFWGTLTVKNVHLWDYIWHFRGNKTNEYAKCNENTVNICGVTIPEQSWYNCINLSSWLIYSLWWIFLILSKQNKWKSSNFLWSAWDGPDIFELISLTDPSTPERRRQIFFFNDLWSFWNTSVSCGPDVSVLEEKVLRKRSLGWAGPWGISWKVEEQMSGRRLTNSAGMMAQKDPEGDGGALTSRFSNHC